ncbi:MAG: CPBP family intramembrane glutamic endopeptidase [Gemmatimonadota bacterium]
MTVFAVLACLFAWSFTLAHAAGLPVESGQFPLGPIIAAAAVSAALGRSGLREWGGRLARLRTSPGWYLFAFLAPIVIITASVLINARFGTPLPTAAQLAAWPDLGGAWLGILIAIGIGEEAGWTAFAAPRLLSQGGMVRAWLILATIRTIWHLPLMLSGELTLALGIGGNFAFQFIVLWLYRRTGVWFLAAIWHTTLNVVSGQFLFRMVSGADQQRLGLIMVAGYILVAIVLAAVGRSFHPATTDPPGSAVAT